ncbi:MAG TPA: ABC transporter substrate-binding protein [Pyrinomonadaceae bacterium]|nr:ABC transporter substrate-binding protein [Pyrinomonadaceae bacterium]
MRTDNLRLYAAALCALALAALALLAAPGSSTTRAQVTKPAVQTAKPPEAARSLTARERRGRAIYLRGESPSGKEIGAVVGELDVPASTVTCAGCHGARGEGKTEGGVTAGDLTWANLTKPYGHTHPTGRKHGPFTEESFARAVAEGVDPSGNAMLQAMPRFKMSPEDMADLLAYLKAIEHDRDPGLSEDSIRVGTLVPSKGGLAETGAAMRDVLAAFFAELNARGGIYNRKVELRVADTQGDAASAASAARRLVADEQTFALVGGLSAGADKELAALTRELEVPLVGPSSLLPQAAAGNRYTFYLLPGVAEMARSLVNFESQKRAIKDVSVAVVYASGEIHETAAAAFEEQCRRAGCGTLRKHMYERGKFDAQAALKSLKGAEVVLFLGTGAGEEADFMREADAAGWRPDVLLLGVLAGRELAASVPAGFAGKVFLAFPSIPSDLTPEGRAELTALAEKYKFPARHVAAQLSALAAAKVLVEGLQRGGKDLSRERLVTALEGLYDFETGVTPRLTFGPNRRVGAAGAYVVTVDAERKTFVPSGEWVKSN